MKRLILMVSLLAPIQAFSCGGIVDYFSVEYLISNKSQYEVRLDFESARHGRNPDSNIVVAPNRNNYRDDDDYTYGCSSGLFTGYETQATLRASRDGIYLDGTYHDSFDLAYLYIKKPFSGDASFSYQKYNIGSPYCSCSVAVRLGRSLFIRSFQYDCSSFTDPVQPRATIYIECK